MLDPYARLRTLGTLLDAARDLLADDDLHTEGLDLLDDARDRLVNVSVALDADHRRQTQRQFYPYPVLLAVYRGLLPGQTLQVRVEPEGMDPFDGTIIATHPENRGFLVEDAQGSRKEITVNEITRVTITGSGIVKEG